MTKKKAGVRRVKIKAVKKLDQQPPVTVIDMEAEVIGELEVPFAELPAEVVVATEEEEEEDTPHHENPVLAWFKSLW